MGWFAAVMLTVVITGGIVVGEATAPRIDELTPIELYERVHRSVVSVQVYVEDLFGQLGQATGSGFVFDDAGHIVTNRHVVQGAQRLVVVFSDGFQVPGSIVGTDPQSDLAVVSVDGLPDNAVALPLGDSEAVEVGQRTAAIGNPFGLGGSMSLGIISAVGRTIPSGATPFAIPLALQTDAAVNPGNSGGPLLNLFGEVIGVNAQIATGGGQGSVGVGFAIPSRVVGQVIPTLIDQGRYEWPWLGVTGQSVDLFLRDANDLDRQDGAYIHSVVEDSPAADVGLRGSTGTRTVDGISVPVGGDVILRVDGVDIESFDDLLTELAFRRPGETVRLSVLRDGSLIVLETTLAPRPLELG